MGQNSTNLAERLLGEQFSGDVRNLLTIDNFLFSPDTVTPVGE